jgi:anti-sigma-K factor RskA
MNMRLQQNPDLIERLAASYALGTLRGGARNRFETLARTYPEIRAITLVWQSRWSAMAEQQSPVPPAPAVWQRISNLVQAQQQSQAMKSRNSLTTNESPHWLASLLLWRGAAALSIALAVLLLVSGTNLREQLENQVAQLQSQLQASPQITYVAVLNDAKSAATMLVTFDPKNSKLVLQRVGGFEESGDKSLQLWALPPTAAPRSLGVLGRDKLLRLTASEADVKEVPTLAISLEPLGGVPSERGPTGPVLFTGHLIKRVL